MADVYITKWALTEGVLLCEKLENSSDTQPEKYCRARLSGALNGYLFVGKPDWHLTLQEVEQRFETMRQAKVKSLEKQLAKLKSAKLNVIDKR